MTIIGIDVGKEGGIFIKKKTGVYEMYPMPTNESIVDSISLVKILAPYKDESICIMEKLAARPNQGVSSMFTFGRSFGNIEGVLSALKIPYQLVAPQTWCKEMHAGVEVITKKDGKRDPKKMSLVAVKRLFPDINFKKNDRCKVDHSGMVDACLLAEYLYRKSGQRFL